MAIQLLFHVLLGTDACCEFRLTATEDKSVIIARSMEFTVDLQSHIIVEPTEYPHSATPAYNCTQNESDSYLNWTNRYSIAYLDAWNTSLSSDGMNSAGLSVASLYLPGFTKYQVLQNPSPSRPVISPSAVNMTARVNSDEKQL